jgi:predicted MFS family arabinose efflux permease
MKHGASSPLAPLADRWFRAFWLSAVVSNTGTWMHEVGAAWTMTALTENSPLMVALIRTATTVPLVLLALPLAVLADRGDRRKFLLVTQTWLACTAGVLAVLAATDRLNQWSLLLLTLSMGLGAAVHGPAWQATLPHLVPRAQRPDAVGLVSTSWNLARTIGPAIGGALVAAWGAWSVFAINAVSFCAVMAVLWRWQPHADGRTAHPTGLRAAMREAIDFVRDDRVMGNTLVRTLLFTLCATSIWALSPVLARGPLGWEAPGVGLLLAVLGAGAVAAIAVVQAWRVRWGSDRLVMGCAVAATAALILSSITHDPRGVIPLMFVLGACWMMTITTLNATAQMTLPSPLRARGMACFLTTFAAGMAFGSLAWGALARQTSLATSLQVAGATLLLTTWFSRHRSLGSALTELADQGGQATEPRVDAATRDGVA